MRRLPFAPPPPVRFRAAPHLCAYLPDRIAQLEYEFAPRLSADEYEARMNDGWRKFGQMLFHPVCATCRECRPIRIPAAEFTPDRGQKRALARNADLRVEYGPPVVDEARVDLHRRYHAAQTDRKGWPEQEKDAATYAATYCRGPRGVPAVEVTLWEGDVLRAVTLTDVTAHVVSGVYHFYDPDQRDRSLGTVAVLQTILLAQKLERRWAYFGFYVAGCRSMEYKARYRPCEILDVDGVWCPYEPDAAAAESEASPGSIR